MDKNDLQNISCDCGNDEWKITQTSIICTKCKLNKKDIHIYYKKDPADIIKEMNIPVSLPNAIELAMARLSRYKKEEEMLLRINSIIQENSIPQY